MRYFSSILWNELFHSTNRNSTNSLVSADFLNQNKTQKKKKTLQNRLAGGSLKNKLYFEKARTRPSRSFEATEKEPMLFKFIKFYAKFEEVDNMNCYACIRTLLCNQYYSTVVHLLITKRPLVIRNSDF